MDADTASLLQLARWAGTHALPLYAVIGLWLCLAATGVWWTLHQWRRAPWAGRWPPALTMALALALGFGVIVAGAAAFAELAEALVDGRRLGLADDAYTEALKHAVPLWALQVFAALTRLGDPWTLVILGVVVTLALLWARRRVLALAWVLALGGNALLNPTLKAVFARVRPPHEGGLVVADGYSFPSGHSSGAVVAFGMAAYVVMRTLPARWHLPALLLAVALAYTIGCSRMFLRVHYASDVVAGFATGTAWLAVCIAGAEVARWWRRRPGVNPMAQR